MRLTVLRLLRKVGEHHTHSHRMIAGATVMTVGVTIAKVGAVLHPEIFCDIADGVGYLIHGIGATPYVEVIVAMASVEK